MAYKISTEILIIVLNNVQSSRSTQDLYSSLLVNRIWCKFTIPLLWELTLGQEYYTEHELRKKALCIRTYISCMDTQVRNLLIQNKFDLSSSPPQAIFDYPSFTHKFIINNLVYFVSIYSQQIVSPDQENSNSDDADEEIVTTESRILFHEICKLIINRCTFLDCFKLVRVPKCFLKNIYLRYGDLIGSILNLPGAPKVFKKLESFTSTIRRNLNLTEPLYESLKLICDNILSMDLSLNSDPQIESLEKLIIVQKWLENLSIAGNFYRLPNSLFWAIISRKETLKSLRLDLVDFSNFKGKLASIGQFISLQELYIKHCYGLHNSDCLFLASSFTQLNSFHYFHSRHIDSYPREFIIEILQTANIRLKNICLDLYETITFDTFSAILNYCTKIIKLSLQNLKEFDADELLCQITKNVPESLEIIEIRMDYNDPWIFSADSLRIFLEGWCCKGGGNKPRILRIKRSLKLNDFMPPLNLVTISSEHFKVIEEYGIRFDME